MRASGAINRGLRANAFAHYSPRNTNFEDRKAFSNCGCGQNGRRNQNSDTDQEPNDFSLFIGGRRERSRRASGSGQVGNLFADARAEHGEDHV